MLSRIIGHIKLGKNEREPKLLLPEKKIEGFKTWLVEGRYKEYLIVIGYQLF